MAEQNNNSTGEQVTFDADAKLEADAGTQSDGPAAINFEASDDLRQEDTKRSPTDKLKEEASKLGTQAADRARAFAGENKDRATGALDDVARMFQSAADDVDAKLGAEYGKYARTAADAITGFADSIRAKEVDDLVADASAFVKKSPAIAVGTAAAVGFVLARLIKSGVDAAADLSERTSDAKSTTAPSDA